MTLTRDDLEILKQPFLADEHKFVKGSGGKFYAYIDEEPIMERIEKVDPGAQWILDGVTHRKDGDTHTVSVWGRLIIKDRTCSGMGSSSVMLSNYTNKKGEAVVTEANEPEKAAETDALKRAARKHGIGRYLLSCTANNVEQMKTWLTDVYPEPPETPKNGASRDLEGEKVTTQAQPVESPENGDALFDMANLDAFKGYMEKTFKTSSKDIADAMMVTFGEPLMTALPKLTKTQAMGAIIAWACSYDVDLLEKTWGNGKLAKPIYDAAEEYALLHNVKNAEDVKF